jgi:hypothetical protein
MCGYSSPAVGSDIEIYNSKQLHLRRQRGAATWCWAVAVLACERAYVLAVLPSAHSAIHAIAERGLWPGIWHHMSRRVTDPPCIPVNSCRAAQFAVGMNDVAAVCHVLLRSLTRDSKWVSGIIMVVVLWVAGASQVSV